MSKKDFVKGDKKKSDDVSVDEVYKEFLETFEDVKKPATMAWVRGDVVNAEKSDQGKPSSTKGRLYKPQSKLEELAASFQSTQHVQSKKPPDLSAKREIEESKKNLLLKKEADKKRTSNLENLKEELKRSQEERAERRRLREQVDRLKNDDPDRKTRFDAIQPEQISLLSAAALRTSGDDFLNLSGSYDADPTTTNIYIQNIDGKVTESILCDLFGKFGPLASVKIMWPRTEEERARGRNAAFVAFMNRPDAERALAILQNRVLQGIPFRLGWGKPVAMPPYPIHMPSKLMELMKPQEPTGLPFNCSMPTLAETKQAAVLTDPQTLQKTLEKAVVRVVVPTERALLHIVHRMVEFVCREGPMFEAVIMHREISNPMFRFLFDNKNPVHIYYRWKLFSILQGDTPRKWRTEDFQMFAGGSIWRPPPLSPFTQSMPPNLLPKEDELPPIADGSERSISPPQNNGGRDRDRHSSGEQSPTTSRRREKSRDDRTLISRSSDRDPKCSLSDRQRQYLEDMLKELTAERRKIADAMVWCLDHAQSAEEVVDCIVESLSIVQTPLPKKIARLYLVSDLLHNASAKVVHAFAYRKFIQAKLIQIFGDLNSCYEAIESRMKKDQFKTRVMSCFRAWEGCNLYPSDFLIYLQNIFFGLVKLKEGNQSEEEDIEGQPINLGGGELDGEPVLTEQTAGLLTSLYGTPVVSKSQADVPEKKAKLTSPKPVSASKPGFQRSKWEEVDPQQIEAQAITTSRWDFFEEPPVPVQQQAEKPYEEDLDGEEISPEGEDEDIDGVQVEDSAALLARMRAVAAARSQAVQQMQQSTTPPSQSGNVNEERRVLLREIEVQVMEYQDELESGQRPRESGISIAQQVQRYREQLVAQVSNSSLFRNRDSNRGHDNRKTSTSSASGSRHRSSSRSPKRKTARRCRSRSRSRSRSPGRKSLRKY